MEAVAEDQTLLSVEELDYLGAYIKKLAHILRLRDWRIRVSDEHCGEHAWAEISRLDDHYEVVIKMNIEWPTMERDALRMTLAHELLHIHEFNGQAIVAVDILGNVRNHALRHTLHKTYGREMELMTDALAAAIAPLLPLPPEHAFSYTPAPLADAPAPG